MGGKTGAACFPWDLSTQRVTQTRAQTVSVGMQLCCNHLYFFLYGAVGRFCKERLLN